MRWRLFPIHVEKYAKDTQITPTKMSDKKHPIEEKCETLIILVNKHLKTTLDYSLISLRELDMALFIMFGKGMCKLHAKEDSEFSKGKEQLLHELETQIGCYYGECIRRAFRGQWVKEKDKGLYLTQIANTDVSIFPFSTAKDRMNGEDSKLHCTSFSLINTLSEKVIEEFMNFEKHMAEDTGGATPPPLPS